MSLVLTALSQVGVLAGWETRALDAFLFLRDRQSSPDIVLVVIDDEGFRELEERQPLSRRYLADLADLLLSSGARVVALDLQLRTPTTVEEDEALRALAGRWRDGAGRLVLATEAIPVEGTAPPPRYALAPLFAPLDGLVGFANAPVADDGVIRRMTSLLPAPGNRLLPSFALAVLAAHAGHSPAALAAGLASEARLPLPALDGRGRLSRVALIDVAALARAEWRIDFVGGPGSFTSFPAGPLVRMHRSGTRPDADNPFRGRIVLVGATFRESRDRHPTPVGLLPGVEIHANMVHTLLARRVLLPPPLAVNFLVLAGACVAVSLLSVWLRPVWVGVVTAVLIAAFVAVSYEAYASGGYWLDFVAPVVGMLAYLEGSRWLARRRLRQAFGEFVSPEVMSRVVTEGARLGGEVRTVSVLMSDLRGFTTMAERRPPAEVSETMNEYLTAMVDAILAHRGMVQDFVGDGILAVFGAPADDPEHGWQAVQTALAMQEALSRLNGRWQAAGRAPLSMGVAVHTGPVFAGYVGSPRKKKYAALGDTVNTVARIEGLNRELGTAILVSGAALDGLRGRVQVSARGMMAVKGRTEPVEVLELHGLADGGGGTG